MADDSGIFTTTGRNSILQKEKRKIWKIADAFFQISSMTDSFKYKPGFVLPLQFTTGPSKLFKFPDIVSRLPSLGGSAIINQILGLYSIY